jgi:hypothetical protein
MRRLSGSSKLLREYVGPGKLEVDHEKQMAYGFVMALTTKQEMRRGMMARREARELTCKPLASVDGDYTSSNTSEDGSRHEGEGFRS